MSHETIIDLSNQCGHPARPVPDVHVLTGGAVAFRLKGLYVDAETIVSVYATNADGTQMMAEAERDGSGYLATFPDSHFAAYGFVENGLRVTLTRDGRTYNAAVGNLAIDPVDATAAPGDPSSHAVTREELAAIADQIELADAATQKEVRVALQSIIAKLKGLASCIVACAAFAAWGIDSTTAWEDMPPTSTVAQVVRQFAPPADLTPATNYTDSATNALGGTLRAEVAAASQAASDNVDMLANELSMGTLEVGRASSASEADSALGLRNEVHDYRSASTIFAQLDAAATTNDLAAATNDVLQSALRADISTNDVRNIVTNETAGTFGPWTGKVDDEGVMEYDLPATVTGGGFVTTTNDPQYAHAAQLYEWADGEGDEDFDPATLLPFEYVDVTYETEAKGQKNVRMWDLYRSSSDTATEKTFYEDDAGEISAKLTRTYTPGKNALGLARMSDVAAATNALDERYLSITGGYVRGTVEIDGSGTGRDALTVQGSIYGMGANFENVDIDYQLNVGEESRLHDTHIDGVLTINGEAVTPSDYATHEDLARFDWVVTNTVREIVFVNGYERLSLEANGTLGVETNGWPDGAGMMLELTPAGPYTVEGIRMLGYSAWPTSRADLVVWRSGTNVFANLVLVW